MLRMAEIIYKIMLAAKSKHTNSELAMISVK